VVPSQNIKDHFLKNWRKNVLFEGFDYYLFGEKQRKVKTRGEEYEIKTAPTQKICVWCGNPFEPTHGNSNYDSAECQEKAKKKRQKQKRDPIKGFLPILMKNHEILDKHFTDGKLEITFSEIEAYDLDISLCRRLNPPTEHVGKSMLDFGTYYLITDTNFQTFKIYKHEADHTT
jgi:hypothetical protein